MQLFELLDYIWPDKVILNFGEFINKQFVVRDQITSAELEQYGNDIYEYAEQNRHFPDFAICDIYARGSIIYIALCPRDLPAEHYGTRHNAK